MAEEMCTREGRGNAEKMAALAHGFGYKDAKWPR
jgi:hypothetical protein